MKVKKIDDFLGGGVKIYKPVTKNDLTADKTYFYMSTPTKDQGIFIFGRTAIHLVYVSNSSEEMTRGYSSVDSGRTVSFEQISGRIYKMIFPRWEHPTIIGEVTIHPFSEIEGAE